MFNPLAILLTQRAGGGKYTIPYDSTQGIPDIVFKIIWVVLLIFLARLLWEFRDKINLNKIFKPKDSLDNKQ